MTIQLTPSEIWELLTYHCPDIWQSIPLHRHMWLAERLKAVDSNTLFTQYNLVLDLRVPTLPVLYTAGGWIDQQKREALTTSCPAPEKVYVRTTEDYACKKGESPALAEKKKQLRALLESQGMPSTVIEQMLATIK